MKKLKEAYTTSLSIDLLEYLGNTSPTQDQIEVLESIVTKVSTIEDMIFSSNLTNREIACLYWAAMGKTATKTAEILGIQPVTVDQYRKEIKKKLACKSMAEAVFKGMQFGHIDSFIRKVDKKNFDDANSRGNRHDSN